MSLLSRAADRVLGLPPALTRDLEVHRDLSVRMPDGVELLADLYVPRRVQNAPTILMRSPYGRRGAFGLFATVFAERGYQVLIQAVRGTEQSGGVFDPFGDETRDGMATLDWIEKQSWFHGTLLTYGPSYLGYVQWAIAADAGTRITAMSPVVAASQFRDQTYLGDAFTLRGCLSWSALVTGQQRHQLLAQLEDVVGTNRLTKALAHLPLGEADELATGRTCAWFQDWLEHSEPGSPYWVPDRDHRARVPEVTAPAVMIGGWYDLFLASQLEDYAALRAAGRDPHLTIGPWTHSAPKLHGAAIRESLSWFRAHSIGDVSALRSDPVRLYVQGAQEWRDFASWPPPAAPTPFRLHAGGALGTGDPADSEPSRYSYDPADPTPGIGGPLLGQGAGPKDQKAVEARSDVLVFTSAPLTGDLEVIGPVTARIHLRSSAEHTDLLVRLCDVDEKGRSVNVCDGLQRLVPGRFQVAEDGSQEVEVAMWPTAYRFRAGHSLRVHVAGGSHPRYSRNPGTGDPLGTATRLVVQHHEILHDPAHPSAVILPVIG
jgi:putative CocE/NonD family hydrolase